MHSKSTSPSKLKICNELTLPVPGRPYPKSHASRLRERECGQRVTLPAPTLAQAAGMALRAGTNRDWKREFISHLLFAFAFAFEGVCVGAFETLCRAQPWKREAQSL